MDYLGYRKLVVYAKAMEMVTKVYQLLKKYPKRSNSRSVVSYGALQFL